MQYNQNLINHTPKYYSELLESVEILSAEDFEFSLIYVALTDILNQFRIGTSTWGISYWEEFVGVSSDGSASIEERRSNVLAKLRGYGTITVEHIKSICESYSGGTVSVTEESENYRVLIKFIDTHGQPSNVEDLKKILREVVPAHLDIEYEFLYNTYSDYTPIPYSEIVQFTYEEILELDLFYRGSKNITMEEQKNEDLEIFTNSELLGGFDDV